ncbi:MAG: response regulator [Planctomycetota bacterium]
MSEFVLLEDDPAQAELLALVLARCLPEWRQQVHLVVPGEAAGLAEGIIPAMPEPPGVLLVDAYLHGTCAADLLPAVRGACPAGVACVILSGDDSPSLRERCLAAGAAGFLLKPQNLADARALAEAVRQTLNA